MTGDRNYAYYVGGNFTNDGNIDMSSSLGSMGIYSYYSAGEGKAINNGTIKVGKSDAKNFIYSIGMGAGYKGDNGEKLGYSINKGTIEVANDGSIGMFATGKNSKIVNDGTINISAPKAVGMFIGEGAIGENTVNGKINILPDAKGATGVYISKNAVFKNYGSIKVSSNGGKGIHLFSRGKLVTEDEDSNVKDVEIASNAKGATKVKKINPVTSGDKIVSGVEFNVRTPQETVVKIDGKIVEPTFVNITYGDNPNSDVLVKEFNLDEKTISYSDAVEKFRNLENLGSASSIGMYVDTSGINFTNPIEGLKYLENIVEGDLIIGSEASKYTNAKVITVKENILDNYNKAINENPQIEKWNILSGSLFWTATPNKMKNRRELDSIVMAKIPYNFGLDSSENEYNFLDGVEQRYDKNLLHSREKDLFNKINAIGKNESVLYRQAIHEMLGNQYASTAQRINSTGNIIDDEILYLRDEWDTKSKNSNKLKVFGNTGEFNTKTAGVKNWYSRSFGIAYLNEKEGVTLGNSKGWYAGLVNNNFYFKDLGKSEERSIQAKLGIFKSKSFDHNNYLNWNIAGDIFVGINNMDRKYLVVDDIFSAKSNNYLTYGASIKNELTKTIRVNENWRLKGYGRLDVEYGRHGNIKEETGEMRLDVASKGYLSVKPEVGAMAVYNKQFHNGYELEAKAKISYTTELGVLNSTQEKAKVGYTSSNYYKLVTEKEDRLGNVKLDLNVDLNNNAWGITGNVGYDVKGNNLRFGTGLRVIY